MLNGTRCLLHAMKKIPDSSGFFWTLESRTLVRQDSQPLSRPLIQNQCLLGVEPREKRIDGVFTNADFAKGYDADRPSRSYMQSYSCTMLDTKLSFLVMQIVRRAKIRPRLKHTAKPLGIFSPSIIAEMLTIAVCTHADRKNVRRWSQFVQFRL